MGALEHLDRRDLVQMMYGSESIENFKDLWEQDKDPEKWSQLLHSCYWELSYTRAGGDEGYLDNPPINVLFAGVDWLFGGSRHSSRQRCSVIKR